MSTTTIEWATHTANPAGGCTEARLSDGTMDPACVHCYARLQSARVSAMGASQSRTTIHDGVSERRGNTARWTGAFRWDRELLRRQFEAMRAGHRTFVGSMTDLWHPDHDPALLVALAEEIRGLSRRDPEPVVITLTKRADRLLAWQREHFPNGLPSWHWAGITAGCQQSADERIPTLLQVKTSGPRVVSVEPMTGPVDLDPVGCAICGEMLHNEGGSVHFEPGSQPWCWECDREAGGLGWLDPDGISWVIAGAESGPKARPVDLAWVRSLRDQCSAAGVPFFYKQGPGPDGKLTSTPELDGRAWTEVPRG